MLYTSYHESWKDFLKPHIINMLNCIEEEIGNDYIPRKENILRFLQQDLSKVKCVWLGQDPYYTLYDNNTPVANGRSFQPDNLNNWNDTFSQKSLQNIIRLIHKNYFNIEKYEDIKKYKEIKLEIGKTFPIKQPKEWFDSLEKQGVLFLNTYFTTKSGKGNAHRKIWEYFSIELLKYISNKNKNIVWFLWGNEAISKEKYILSNKIVKSNHPTFCSSKYKNDFLKSDCFKNIKTINWLG